MRGIQRHAQFAGVGIEAPGTDGRGPGGALQPHLGLLGMRERVTLVGGELRLGAARAGGLRVEADLPMRGGA